MMIKCRWDGERFYVVGNYSKTWCFENLKEHELVSMEMVRGRSESQHRKQFAVIRNAWANLPEKLIDAPYAASPETLRKHALIVTGTRKVKVVECGTSEVAERVAAAMEEDSQAAGEYCIISIAGTVVQRLTAKSQKEDKMSGPEFKQSSERAMDWIANLISTTPKQLDDEAQDDGTY